MGLRWGCPASALDNHSPVSCTHSLPKRRRFILFAALSSTQYIYFNWNHIFTIVSINNSGFNLNLYKKFLRFYRKLDDKERWVSLIPLISRGMAYSPLKWGVNITFTSNCMFSFSSRPTTIILPLSFYFNFLFFRVPLAPKLNGILCFDFGFEKNRELNTTSNKKWSYNLHGYFNNSK